MQELRRASFTTQFFALMRKNWILKKRAWCSTLLEILLPVVAMLIFSAIRSAVKKTNEPDVEYYDRQQYTYSVGNALANIPVFANQSSSLLAFVPDSAATRAYAAALIAAVPTFAEMIDPTLSFFPSDRAVTSYLKSPDYKKKPTTPSLWAVVGFDAIGTPSDPTWSYYIRMNASGDPSGTNDVRDPPRMIPETGVLPRKDDITYDYQGDSWGLYATWGFTALQTFTDQYAINMSGGVPSERLHSTNYKVVPFPTVAHISDDFANFVGSFLGLFFILLYLWPVTRVIKCLVEEKESRMRETMKIMSVRDSAIWSTWWLTYVVIFFIMSILIVIVTGNIFENSNKGIVFFLFFLFGLSVFSFCFLMSVFFTRARVAATMGSIIFLGIFFCYFAVSGKFVAQGSKTAACLSSPVAFSLGVSLISELESAGTGVTNDNLNTNLYNFNVGTALGFLVFDSVLYIVIALYLQEVLPSTYGVRRPWNFLFMRSTYCDAGVVDPSTVGAADDAEKPNPNIERTDPAQHGPIGVAVRKLRKVFESIDAEQPPLVAVDGVSMDLYEGEIFALLGHNGAGKTTTINMLTGMYMPTSGDALIGGRSILTDMPTIRNRVGVCPQFNVLWPQITVGEHLEIFARLKGVEGAHVDADVRNIVAEVGLTEKINSRSVTLSGGQQRKLSLGMALIGGSKVVFLDEPTSGMDPYSRRSTWEMLRRAKQGRVIILTTHFMDEADELGDRIAIMARGVVQCLGSSLFLKSRYGVGYTMTVTKAPQCDDKKIQTLVLSSVRGSEVLSNAAGEIAFRLPFSAASSLPDVFERLDREEAALGVATYGISVTTLEEVFLRVGRDEHVIADAEQQETREVIESLRARTTSGQLAGGAGGAGDDNDDDDEKDNAAKEISSRKSARQSDAFDAMTRKSAPGGTAGAMGGLVQVASHEKNTSLHRHVYAMLVKRWNNARRDKKVWTWTLLYPFLIILAGVGLVKVAAAFSYTSTYQDTRYYDLPNRVTYNDGAWAATQASSRISDAFFGNSVGVPFVATNISDDREFSRHLLRTRTMFRESRYSAWRLDESDGLVPQNPTLFFNTTGRDALPVTLNLYHNAMLVKATGNAAAKIQCELRPFPRTADQVSLTNSITAVMLSIGFAFIPASYVAFLVAENESKAKHQQLISGVNTTAYWIANYIWDFCNFMVPGLFAVFVVAIYSIDELTGENAGVLILLIVLYALSVAPWTYVASFFFRDSTVAQNTMLMLYIFCGAVLLVANIVLSILESTKDAQKKFVYAFRVLPPFCFGEGVAGLIVRKTALVYSTPKGPLHWDVTGKPLLYMACESVVFFLMVLVIEYVLATPALLQMFTLRESSATAEVAPTGVDDDEDVAAERQRVLSGGADKDIIRVIGLRKAFPAVNGAPPKVAVRDLHFGVPEGECFGFLGINGAGKTTSIRMLCGDELPTRGTAILANTDILQHPREVRSMIGYCPQFDAIVPTLTARETLVMYSRIKGIPEDRIPDYTSRMIAQLGLEEYADRPCGGYSGGNKRKLGVGVALIGDPSIVFLDEPSTGMDPKSRRFMWDLISSTMAGRSVILTTHSMEECEALCRRIGIMVGGRMRCLGTSQHLKHRYGSGYQVDLNLTAPDKMDGALQFFTREFPGFQVLEKHPRSVKLRISRSRPLGEVFRTMEANRGAVSIAEYSVSETTLEQIFIHFARQQEEEQGTVAGFEAPDSPLPTGARTPQLTGVIVDDAVEMSNVRK